MGGGSDLRSTICADPWGCCDGGGGIIVLSKVRQIQITKCDEPLSVHSFLLWSNADSAFCRTMATINGNDGIELLKSSGSSWATIDRYGILNEDGRGALPFISKASMMWFNCWRRPNDNHSAGNSADDVAWGTFCLL